MQLDKASYGGSADGTASDGTRVAVPFAIPDETVEVSAQCGGEVELVQLLEPSANRVVPLCQHFGACGGCQYQHIAYDAQAQLKAGILRGLLEAADLAGLPEIALHTSEPWGYRNRIRLRIETIGDAVRVGYIRRASNVFLPIAMCPIASPVLWRSAVALVNLTANDALCARWMHAVSEVEIFTNGDQSRLQMSFFLRDAEVARQEPEAFAGFCERRQGGRSGTDRRRSGDGPRTPPARARRAWDGEQWGGAGIAYSAAGTRYWVSRGAFFQVNRFLVDNLVQLATTGRSGTLAWDLYAGVGLFSKALAAGFSEVVAVEGAEGSVQDLTALARSSARESKIGAIHPVHAATVDFLRERVLQRARPDLIVMDPPRAGVGIEGCELLFRIKARELVYVSCDPVTLARDLQVLTGAGYAVQELHLVDLFPQTFHMETVAILRYTR